MKTIIGQNLSCHLLDRLFFSEYFAFYVTLPWIVRFQPVLMKEFIDFTKLDSWYMEEKLQSSKKSRETSVLCLETINHVGCTLCVRWFCLFVENESYEWKNSAILTNFCKPNAAFTIQQQHKHQGQNCFVFFLQ